MITPITRKELYLAKIIGEDVDIPETAKTREELFFLKILDNFSKIPEPITREELFLAKISGQDVELPEPKTRLELFLAKAAGVEIETPTPITREEIFWSNYSAIVDFEVEGVPPLTYKAIEGALENYRIYGDTVDSESVGDRTGNLFDFGEWSKNIKANVDNSLVKGIDGITITANSNDAFTAPYAYTHESVYKIYVKPNTNYLFSWTSNNDLSGRVFIFKNGMIDGTRKVSTDNSTTKYLLFGTDADTEFITLRFGVATAGNTITYSKIMLNEGSTLLPYEPYGYKVPVMVTNGTDAVTTPIYLPEPIKMIGDEAEYVDYAEQKQHRVRKNLLPNIAASKTISGVTFTVNADGSVTCNGTNTTNSEISFNISTYLLIGTYIINGCPKNGSLGTYSVDLRDPSNWYVIGQRDTGLGFTFTNNTVRNVYYSIRINTGYTCDNLTFYPMIRKADIEDDTYEPYIENTELDVILPALPTLSGTNTLSVGTEVQPSKVYIKGQKERD